MLLWLQLRAWPRHPWSARIQLLLPELVRVLELGGGQLGVREREARAMAVERLEAQRTRATTAPASAARAGLARGSRRLRP